MEKKTLIKVGIIIIITCVMCFSDWSFAAVVEWWWENLDVLGFSLNYVVCVLGWLWVFFAKLAGTFLTNNWVYGELLWIDALMWKYWSMMKNIANFGLWFYFVYAIFKWLINQWKEDITQKLKKIILWLLIAWVWIQASWFFTAAVIDVSTITLSAVWSFPSQVISGNPSLGKTYEESLVKYLTPIWQWTGEGKELSLFPKEGKESNLLETKNIKTKYPVSVTGLVDSLMPNDDDVSWPLYYIWFSILRTNVVTSINTSNKNSIKATILNTIIQWWTTIIFAIEMLILCIMALMRIIYLWMFIVLSPLAILLRCIEKSWEKLWEDSKSFISRLMKQINFKSFFINVFKPTIIVLWFWIAVLFVSLMRGVIDDSAERPFDLKWTTINSIPNGHSDSWNPWDQTYTTRIDNNLLSFTLANTWKTFLEIILSIITVLIVYFILKFAVKFWDGKDFVSEKIWKVQDEVDSLMESIPIMPVSWYDEEGNPTKRYMSAGQVFGLWGKNSILQEKVNKYQRDVDKEIYEQGDIIDSWTREDNKLSSSEKNSISTTITQWLWNLGGLENAKKEIEKIRTKEWKWMKLDPNAPDQFWRTEFTRWLNTRVTNKDYGSFNRQWKTMIDSWENQNRDESKRNLTSLFQQQNYAQAYAEFFGYKWSYIGFESIRDLDISKNPPSQSSTP